MDNTFDKGFQHTNWRGKLCKEKKPVYVNLWQPTDNKSVVTSVFRDVHPIVYRMSILLMVVFVTLFLAFTGTAYKVLLTGLNTFGQWFLAGTSLAVAVYMFLGIKSDSLYLFLFKSRYLNNRLKHKVLIIDDFDRVSSEQQEDAYKVFHILKGKVPIIFVGDYTKLENRTEKYLKKIIDKRVELPYVLQPQNIWDDYLNQLSKQLGNSDLRTIRALAVSEQLNLRDRNHFDQYVQHEFVYRNKCNHVVIPEELLIIYLYVFHNDIYRIILHHKPNHDDFKGHEEIEVETLDLWNKDGDNYPKRFVDNPTAYFLYESAKNKTIEELESIIDSPTQLKKYLQSSDLTDFSSFITAKFSSLTTEKQLILFETSLKVVGDHNENSLLRFIISEFTGTKPEYVSALQISYPTNMTQEEFRRIRVEHRIDFWDNILTDAEYDTSMKFYFYYTFTELSISDLGNKYQETNLDLNSKIPVSILFVYLSANNLWYEFDEWTSDIWNFIHTLPAEDFLEFGEKLKFLTQDAKKKNGLIVHKYVAVDATKSYSTSKLLQAVKFTQFKELEDMGHRLLYSDEDPLAHLK